METIASGGEIDITFHQLAQCNVCDGSGCAPGTKPETCSACGGRGQVRGGGLFGFPQPCSRCDGKGTIIPFPCKRCSGSGRARNAVTLRIPIPLGAETGQRLRVDGEGHQGIGGGEPGDLYVELSTEAHPVFTRQGADLHCGIDVSFPTMFWGGDAAAPTLEESVTIKIPAGSQAGRKLRLKGKGLPHVSGGGRGHLYVQLNIIIPNAVSTEERALLQELERSFQGPESGEKQATRSPWWRRFFN